MLAFFIVAKVLGVVIVVGMADDTRCNDACDGCNGAYQEAVAQVRRLRAELERSFDDAFEFVKQRDTALAAAQGADR